MLAKVRDFGTRRKLSSNVWRRPKVQIEVVNEDDVRREPNSCCLYSVHTVKDAARSW